MAKKGKDKGFLDKAASFLGSIPSVANVAKKAVKTTTKKAKKAASSAKKKVKKKAKKAKKKLGKVYTKARKTANNLSKSKIVKQVKKVAKKSVLATKKAAQKTKKAVTKAAQKTKKAVKKASQKVKAAVKDTKKVMKKVGGKIAYTYTSFKEGGYKGVASAVLDFVPVIGNIKAGIEIATGKEMFTNRKLENWERGVGFAAVFGGGLVKGAVRGGKFASGIVAGSKNTTKNTELAKKQIENKGTGNGSKKTNVADFDAKTATNKQKGNFGEIQSFDNLLNNKSLKEAGYDLKPIGRGAPSSINDKIVKGIDGLYENKNPDSNIKYVR
ncbi:hypothetical protein CSE16_09145 [Solibacillus sp. R5-41]|nr:pre-toxin TG domain-containing protein [Solibacillus sp. R5-41]ATP40196.1 hypothetical protein CSE16_09145 [Solibacillus sp. R5-41]